MSTALTNPASGIDLSVQLGRLTLRNPILTASGTFGYAREMEQLVDFSRLGGIVPKTVTQEPRPGNRPWRTVETAAGLLNSIGLDNDGIEAFIEHHLPYLRELPTATIVSIAGRNHGEFVAMAQRLDGLPGVAAIELNISCPNVAHGVDYGADPVLCGKLVAAVWPGFAFGGDRTALDMYSSSGERRPRSAMDRTSQANGCRANG